MLIELTLLLDLPRLLRQRRGDAVGRLRARRRRLVRVLLPLLLDPLRPLLLALGVRLRLLRRRVGALSEKFLLTRVARRLLGEALLLLLLARRLPLLLLKVEEVGV